MKTRINYQKEKNEWQQMRETIKIVNNKDNMDNVLMIDKVGEGCTLMQPINNNRNLLKE